MWVSLMLHVGVPPSAPRSRTMQDQAAGSAVGWNAAQSHVVSAEQRVLQPGAGGNVGAVANFATDLLLQQATFAPCGGSCYGKEYRKKSH